MATTVTESQGVKVITEVVHQTDPRAAQLTTAAPQLSLPPVQGFKKAQPKALGTIQIVASLTQISFGIALTLSESTAPALPVTSGVYFWVGFLLLSSGSMLVEAEKRESIRLVKACRVVSGLVIVATLVAVIIHCVALTQNMPWCSRIEDGKMITTECSRAGYILTNGIDSVSILLCLLELCTAIAALVYSHKALKQQDYRQMLL